MFQVLDDSNSTKITLNNNLTGHSEQWIIGRGVKATWYAVFSFAQTEGIDMQNVGYSVEYTASKEDK